MKEKFGAETDDSIARKPMSTTALLMRNLYADDLVRCEFSYKGTETPIGENDVVFNSAAFSYNTRYPTENYAVCVRMLRDVIRSLESGCRETPRP
jgi:hypothetical protein